MKSNYSEIFDNEISSYFGNVRIDRADQQMSSNAANYDSVTGKLEAQGDVYYSDDDMSVHTDTASFDLANDQAKLHDVLFIAPSAPLRGHAGAVQRESKTISRYQDVAYTSCPTGNQDWVIHASELEINREDGRGSAQNAWLEFKGAPVFIHLIWHSQPIVAEVLVFLHRRLVVHNGQVLTSARRIISI